MRYILFVLLVLFVLSCDNELDLIAENREVPVVYGLIDQTDTAQYIRVERIFVDKDIPPAEIAQNPDSLYYEDITVKLITQDDQEYILERVDGNSEGLERETGAFATSPNYLYKVLTSDLPLVENEEIRLRIEGIFEDTVVTSTTTIVEAPFLASPQNGDLISFIPNRSINIGWNPRENSVIYTALIHMNISEFVGTDETEKRLTWLLVSDTDKRILENDGSDFYLFLVDQLEENSSITRKMNSLEFELISGNQEIAEYIRVGQANLGITSSGEIPVLSNIDNGLGVFGATHTHLRIGLQLSQISRDSLFNSILTRDLNFE